MSERTRVRRLAERGRYDRETLYAILDEGLVCHVGFVADGQPYVIPMGYARDGDRLILHGSAASRLLRRLGEGMAACVTVTLLDGIVLARSTFSSSMNYRSVVALGRAARITDPEEKRRALDALVEHLAPGRGRDARPASERELAATEVLEFPLDEASAKIRGGPPQDLEADYALPIWAGVVPLAQVAGAPESDPALTGDLEPPEYAVRYRRPSAGEREAD